MGGSRWEAVACSIVGDLHIKKSLPNQDAIGFYKMAGDSPAFVMAVSDGHGSDKCPRSNIGSSLAVNTAIKVFIDFWSLMQSRLYNMEVGERRTAMANVERHIRKDLTKQLVDHWGAAVEGHSASTPFKPERERTQRLLAYGATLTVVFVCDYFTTCMRLGDCEVLIVGDDSSVNRVTPRDKQQIGEETDSLCMPDSYNRFHVLFRSSFDNIQGRGNLFLVCSDGYEKAFENNAGFEKSALDFSNLVANRKGRETIEMELEHWLREYSCFSGDDVSVGLLFERPSSAEFVEPSQAELTTGRGDAVTKSETSPYEQPQTQLEDNASCEPT